MKLHPENYQEAVEMLRIKCSLCCITDIKEETGISHSTIYRISKRQTKNIYFRTFIKLCYYFDIEVNIKIAYEAAQVA